MESIVTGSFFVLFIIYEWVTGNYKKGTLSKTDYKMFALCAGAIALVQRPLVMLLVFTLAGLVLAPYQGALAFLDEGYFWPTLLAFILLEEFFHGLGHWFAHSRTPKTAPMRVLHKLFRTAHRPHHLIGNDDDNARLAVGQNFVEGWMYWFVMPNIWFSFVALYLGLTEVFMYGMIFKGVWTLHVHTNWQYDLYFLNHKRPIVRKIAYALAHVFTFPNQHHHHHARGRNSGKNLQNVLSLYDWLFWGTRVIELEAPKRYGWRQTEEEKKSALYRFTRTFQ